MLDVPQYMRISVKHRKLGILAALAFVASCGDNTTEPTVNASGSVTFGYTGSPLVNAGSYSANGSLPTSQTAQATQQWAAGFRDSQDNNNIGVVASVPRATSRYDMAMLVFDRSTAGSSTINVNCSAASCAAMILFYNLSESSTATGEVMCGIETGTMTLATVSATRASGTFSGTGSCISMDDFTTESTFSVTNGSFDVPLLTDVPGGTLGAMISSR